MRNSLVLIGLFWIFLSAQAQVSGTVERTKMKFGEVNTLSLKAFSKEKAQANLEPLRQATTQIISEGKWESKKDYQEQIIEITILDSGLVWIPSLDIQVGADILQTDSIPIEVQLPDSMAQNLNPLKSIIQEPTNWRDYLFILYIILGVAAVIGLIWYFIYRKREPKEVEAPAPVIIPPHIIALQELKALKAKNLIQESKYKRYYSELTYILRKYLEGRFGIQALEKTSNELIKALKQVKLEEGLRNQFADIFTQVDLIKFAKATPSQSMHENVFDLVEKFVQDTKPVENKEVSDG